MRSLSARSPFCRIAIFLALAALALPTAAQAASQTWTGNTDSNWTTITNWNSGNGPVPGSADTALFNNAGNGMTSISLGGASQTASAIQFDTSFAAAYTLGTMAGDALSLASAGTSTTGAISVTSTVVNPQAINAAISFSVASPFITNASTTPAATLTLGSSASPSTLTAASGTITVSAVTGATVTINDAITGGVAVTPTGTGTIQFMNGNSTYSGQTSINTATGTIIQIGASSNSGGTAGPFGTSTIVSNASTNSLLQAVGANQTIANPFTFNFGFTVSNAATPFNLTFTGPISYPATTSRTLTFNSPGQTVTLGSSPTSASTITLSNTASIALQVDTSLNTTLVINDVIKNGSVAGSVSYNSVGANTPEGIYKINGANTYSGGTGFGAQSSGTFGAANVLINVPSVGNPGAITSGPFGTGTITPNDSNAPPVLIPIGADRTVPNAFTLTSGFFVASATSAQDSTLRNLNLTGQITNTGKTITNNMMPTVALYLGTATTSSANTWTGTTTFQSQLTAAGAGTTIIYDTIAGGGGITVQNGATVQINSANTYSGTTTLTNGTSGTSPNIIALPGGILLASNTSGSATGSGAVNVLGTGGNNNVGGSAALGTGGVLGGTGTISGLATISTNSAATQGGVVYPGPGGATPGTLNVGAMTWNPYGRYVFVYNSTNNATGGGTNSLISGSGALSMVNLGSTSTFDLNLVPVNFSGGSQTYTIANFVGGISGLSGAISNGTDISSLFTFSGTFGSTPTAMVVGGTGGSSAQAIQLTFVTPVPEPVFVLAACGGLTALIGWRRARRRT